MFTLLFLIFLLAPTQLGKHFWPSWTTPLGLRVDYLSPTLYLTDLLLVLLLLLNFKQLYHFFLSHRRPFLSVSFVLALNLIFSLQPLNTLVFLFRLLLYTNLIHLLSRLSPKKITLLIKTLFVSTLLVSLLSITQFFLQRSLNGLFYWLGERTFTITTPGIARLDFCLPLINFCLYRLRPYATLSHPNSLAGFLLVSLILLFLFRSRLKTSKKIFYPALALISLAFILASSKAAYFTLVFIFLLFRFHLSQSKRLTITLVTFVLITLGTLLLPTSPSFPLFLNERLLLAQFSLRSLLIRPLTGLGLNNYLLGQSKFYSSSFPSLTLLLQPVHNLLLLLLVELGLLLLPLTLLLRPLLKKARPLLLPALLAVLLLSSLDHYHLTLPQNRLLLAILLGLILNPRLSKTPSHP